ncbi:hypothetical protein DFJ77DRAFT_475363 [Powellomyces hirtus]|nr:hypothetical protein DFJ77DRAFT_475363 [Powellomyces hirtus]
MVYCLGKDNTIVPTPRPPTSMSSLLGPDIMFRILSHISNRHVTPTPTLATLLTGQRSLLEASLVNHHWYDLATKFLWQDPVFRSFPDVLQFALGLRWSETKNTTATTQGSDVGRSGMVMGDRVKRLCLPPCPLWSVGGPPMLGSVMAGIAQKCTHLRTLKLDAGGNSDVLDINALAQVFSACPQLTALRMSVTLNTTHVGMEVDEGDDDDMYEVNADRRGGENEDEESAWSATSPTSEDEIGEDEAIERVYPTISPADTTSTLTTGISRLSILDLCTLRSHHRSATRQFISTLCTGLSPRLTQLYINAFEQSEPSRTRMGDIRALLATVAASCPNIKILHVLLPDTQSEHGDTKLSGTLSDLATRCGKMESLSIRHRIKQQRPGELPETLDTVSPVVHLRRGLCDLISACQHITQLDIQGLEASRRLLNVLVKHAPRCLHTLMMDIDACPPPDLYRLIVNRGANLRVLSLLTVLSLPSHHILDAIARTCQRLRYLDLRHKPPATTENTDIARFPLPEKWIATLQRCLRKCSKLTRCSLSWLPPCQYLDPQFEMESQFAGLITWDEFPATGATLPLVQYRPISPTWHASFTEPRAIVWHSLQSVLPCEQISRQFRLIRAMV